MSVLLPQMERLYIRLDNCSGADVPADVEALLARLSLSEFGPALVMELGFTLANAKHLTEADLTDPKVGMKPLKARTLLRARLDASFPRYAAEPPPPRVRIHALVIGINAYTSTLPRLQNAVADATAVHEELSKLPGVTSTLVTDCSKLALKLALVDFSAALMSGGGENVSTRGIRMSPSANESSASASPTQRTLALVFYAGHGLQVNRRNYLVPSNFVEPSQNPPLSMMRDEMVRACVSLEKSRKKERKRACLRASCCSTAAATCRSSWPSWERSAPSSVARVLFPSRGTTLLR